MNGWVYSNDNGYAEVFDEAVDRQMYLACLLLDRQVENYLSGRDDLLRVTRTNIRFYMTTYLAAALVGKAIPTDNDIVKLLLPVVKISIPAASLANAYKVVEAIYSSCGADDKAAKGTEMTEQLVKKMSAIKPLASANVGAQKV